jgi:hypothetical protein
MLWINKLIYHVKQHDLVVTNPWTDIKRFTDKKIYLCKNNKESLNAKWSLKLEN